MGPTAGPIVAAGAFEGAISIGDDVGEFVAGTRVGLAVGAGVTGAWVAGAKVGLCVGTTGLTGAAVGSTVSTTFAKQDSAVAKT